MKQLLNAHQYGLQPIRVDNLSITQECQSFTLANNDVVKPSNFILYAVGATLLVHSIAKVIEMLHVTSGASSCVYFLIQSYMTSDFVMPYQYPSICAQDPEKFELIEARVCCCINTGYLCKVPDAWAVFTAHPNSDQYFPQLCATPIAPLDLPRSCGKSAL